MMQEDLYTSLTDSAKLMLGRFPLEAKALYIKAGALITTPDDRRMTTVYNGIGASMQKLDDHDSAIYYYKKALAMAKLNGLVAKEASIRANIGTVFLTRGEFLKALNTFKSAAHVFEETNEKKALGWVFHIIATTYSRLGYLDSAMTALGKSKLIYESIPNDRQLLRINQSTAFILIRKGRYSEAYTILREYLQKCKDLGYHRMMIRGYAGIGEIYIKQQNYDSAMVYYVRSLQQSRRLESLSYRANILHAIATIYTNIEEYDSAQWYFEKALPIVEKLKLRTEKARILGALGRLYFYLENYDLATDYLQESISIYRQAATYSFFYPTIHLIEVYLEQKEYQNAVELAVETRRQLRDSTDMIIKRDLLILCAKSYEVTGRYEEANEVYREYNKIQSKIAKDNETKKLAEAALTDKFDKEKEALKASEKLKEEQIAYLELKDEFRTRLSIFLFIILALLVLSSMALFFLNKRLRKANKVIFNINKELTESNELKNKLFTVIAHDIRAPISDMLVLLDILKEKSGHHNDNKAVAFIESQESYVQNLKITLDDIAHWSATQSNVLHVAYDTVNLQGLVDQIIKSYSITLGNKGISIHNFVRADHKPQSDVNILSLCLRNVISNAIKFSDSHDNIWVFDNLFDNYFEIVVCDEGSGMSRKDIQAILFHEKNVSTHGDLGSVNGLGLAMTIEFLKKIEGRLSMESEVGEGTIVTIRVPLVTNHVYPENITRASEAHSHS